MRVHRAVIATMLLVSALFVHMNGELVDDWASKQAPREQTEPLSLLGIQANEEWLVLQDEFPNSPYSESRARSLLMGVGSAEEYIEEMIAGSSTLSVTLFG